jgi:hypothetical protein
MTSKRQSKSILRRPKKDVVVTVSPFDPFEFRQLKDYLLKKFGAVIFYPFYDNGEISGYAIPKSVRPKRENEKVLEFDETLVRDIALKNATKGKKTWIEIQPWGITTREI